MRKVDNKRVDEIGKALVKADAFSKREVEQIVANPALFESVRMRIALEGAEPKVRRSKFRPQPAAFASLALIAGVAFVFVAFRQESDVVARRPVAAPAKVSDVKQFPEPDRVAERQLPPLETPMRIERISNRPSVRSSQPRQRPAQQTRHEGEFYALSYAGDPNETERGGRIVRVDIPRSTLFAMGVDIPLENETETVKADLLVGSDGVTRGIRVVR